MNRRSATLLLTIFAALTAGVVLAADALPPRTEWGDPDLRGIWSNATVTPLERPAELGDKTHHTEEEAAALRGTGLQTILEAVGGTSEGELTGELNEVWLEAPVEVVDSRRTSQVVDPADGQIPFTEEGRQRQRRDMFRRFTGSTAESHEDLHMGDRCLLFLSVYFANPFYLNNHQIFQTPDHVAILSEYGPMTRIIPLDDTLPLDESIPLWNGSSRGRWEGETLVVETANYDGRTFFQGATEDVRVIERFRRVDEDTIDYTMTATDPASFTQPWTIENNLRATEGPLYEFACHEGNYGLVNVLSGARASEKSTLEEAAPR